MSPYLNREMDGVRRHELEAHYLNCLPCGDELEYMRQIVAGLRGMPQAHPPSDFASRVVQRWKREKDSVERADLAAAATVYPEEASEPAAVERPSLAPALDAAARRPAWMPPERPTRQAFSFRSLAALAATIAVVFMGGLSWGRQMPNDLPIQDVVNAALPVAMNVEGNTQGKIGTLNTAILKLAANKPLRQGEVEVQVPAGVHLQAPEAGASNPLHSVIRLSDPVGMSEQDEQPSQIVLIPCAVPTPGEWEHEIQWQVVRPGTFHAWVEVRSQGVYKRTDIEFTAGR